MHLFRRLLVVSLAILAGILLWDLNQERLEYPGKKLIIYAGMFGPGEPMQQLYGGPPPATVPRWPFGKDHADHYRALAAAWPAERDRIAAGYRAAHDQPLPVGDAPAALVERYRALDRDYVAELVAALGRPDRSNRLRLFNLFAKKHPQFDRRLITEFETLHPAWTIGLFEDFHRRHPDYHIVERWDGRWVLSSNRPRFLTGADVPDIIGGSVGELRILMRENLALPLDQPLAKSSNPSWQSKGVLDGEPSYVSSTQPFRDDIFPGAIDKSRYQVTAEDVRDSGNPYPVDTKVLYLLPQEYRTFVVFYNKVHFRLIGRDGDAAPKTVEEFETICRKLKQTPNPAGGRIEPIAQDGMTYINYWWDWLVIRTIGMEAYLATVRNAPGAKRFAGPNADPRYLEIARRLRRWRDEKFWMEGFSSSQWPAAQRDFGNGKVTFLLTGSWLPAEIASTMSRDPKVFEMGCFMFPRVEGADSPDAESIQIATQGHAVCAQGKNPEGAVLLLKYLMAHGGELQARKIASISGAKSAPFPEAMRDIRPAMTAVAPRFLDEGPGWYAPKFTKFVINETHPKFFLIRPDGLSPEQFVEQLEQRAQKHYAENGGQAR